MTWGRSRCCCCRSLALLYLARASRFVVFCPRATMAYAGILAILSLGQYCGRHAGLYTDPTGFRPTMIPLRLRVCLLHGPYVSLLHMRSGNIYRNPSDTSPHRRFPPSILCPPDPKTRRTCSSVCRALRLRLRRSRCRTEAPRAPSRCSAIQILL